MSFCRVVLLYFSSVGQKFRFLLRRLYFGILNFLLDRFTTFPDGSVVNFGCPIALRCDHVIIYAELIIEMHFGKDLRTNIQNKYGETTAEYSEN